MPRKESQLTSTNKIRKSIEKKTEEFLNSGGKITEIPYGTSGQPSITDFIKVKPVKDTKLITKWGRDPLKNS